MDGSAWEAFDQQLSCEDDWHADCEPLPWPPPAERILRLAERNAVHLSAIAALEERRNAEAADEDSVVMQELARLDAKLTALVEMVNRLALPASMLPPRQRLTLNALGALLPSPMVPPGEALVLRVRVDACLSLPLELPGRIERRIDDARTFVAFHELGDGVFTSLERFVFRHHRRKVAGARLGAT